MENNNKYLISLFLIVVAFVAGYQFNGFLLQQYYKTAYSIDGMDFSLLKRVWDQVSTYYVDPSKIDQKKLSYGAAAGLVSAIGDPYTEFFNPDESKKLNEDITGSFEGIGIQMGIKDGAIKVIAPLKGSPAEQSGLRPGDQILAVDKKATADLSIDEVIDLMRGPKGTKVVLTIAREGEKQTRDIEITRDVINVPTLSWEIKDTPSDKKVAYLTLYQFTDKIFDDFKRAAYDILSSNVSGIVLDLRNNPGGLVNQATDIAGWFIDKDQLILTEQERDGSKTEYKSAGPGNFVSYPLVVLINQGSASASEILAGALRDDRNIMMIGETSFGKGTVQKISTLDDGSSLKITVAKWYTPSGERIQDTGIKPTIEVKMTTEDYNNNLDPQLDEALKQIDKIIK